MTPSFHRWADVRLELIQLRFPAGGLDQQLLDAAGAGEPLHGLAVQSGDAADRGQRFAGVQPSADLGVAFPGACHQAALPAAHVQEPVRRDLPAFCLPWRFLLRRARRTRRVVAVGAAGLVLQAAAVAGHRLLGVFGQVVPQMPAVGDLDRVRRARPGALGVVAGPVPADDSRAGMRRQPRLQRGGLPVRQQVDHVPGAHVHQHRPVDLALGQREVIDPEHLRRGRDLRIRRRRDQPQHRGRVHGDPEGPGQPGGGAPGQLQPEPGQHGQQRHAAPPVPFAHPRGLLGEGDRRALPGSGSGTGAPARRSAPAGRPPRRQPPCAHTRRAPAPTPDRTAGSTPSPPGTTRRSSPRLRRLPPGARAAPPGAGTARPAGPAPAQRHPRRRGRRSWPARQAAWQTDPATGLPGAVILADHRVNNGASLPAHAATPCLSQIVTTQAPAAARGESHPRPRH